ncbi:protein SON isoform X2 [Hyla sarda]|uniref:protein SON isoform X2 n=1 Tax=Hyla sarda TaxID=327740 RepID=UPI0024C31BF2|nr:protein SON isoform X2 [Hyla sarda]
MKITGDQSGLSISQAGTGTAAPQCEDPSNQLPITQLPGPIENMDGSHNGDLTAPGTEAASEGSSVVAQNEGSSQTVTNTEDTESKPMEIIQTPAEEKEGESKDLKTTDLSSDDEVKRDSSKKKSKKHKKHKSKKKKKKKKKEKNEKRSKSTSSVEDQENATSESKSAWQPVIASLKVQDTTNTVSSQVEENVDALPSLGDQDSNLHSEKDHPAKPQLDIDFGFFGPKCPNEMHFPVSSKLTISEVEMPEQSKELAVDIQQNSEKENLNDQNNVKQHTNCETAEALQKEMSVPQQSLVRSEGKSVELQESRVDSEENKHLEHLDNVSSVPLEPESKSTSTSLLAAKSRSRSNSLAKKTRSRSKSLTKVPKKQASSKSLTRQRSPSTSMLRRRRSRSSSVGQRRRSKSKSPIRRRWSRSSTPARYSKSPIRSWWSKSIRNRQRSVSIERRRRSRTRSLAKRRRSRSRSSEKGRLSRTRSSAKRIRSRSRSTNRRKSRSTSRKHRLRSRSTSRRKSKSSSPSRKRKSKSASPLRRQKSKTASPVRRGRSRSRSAVQKRRSRSASRRHKSRSVSGSRRRKSRSASFTRRRRSRSGFASWRRKSRSGSTFRRRRSRSVVASRRRSRSPSVSWKRRSRSLSASRRRRSRSASASRRRRSRTASRRRRSRSASRRRRSRSTSVSRRRMSRSVSKRRRSRSTSASRRRRSRSTSRRRRSRSASRRRRSRSPSAPGRLKSRSVSRRCRSRSDSVLRRRRSRSESTSRQKSRFGSRSKTRKSRSGSDTRRPRSNSQQKSRSYSTTKRKSRSTSVSRGEQSTLQSGTTKVQSSEDRRSRSKGDNRKSRSRSASVTLKSLESEPKLQTKSFTEQRQLEKSTMECLGPNRSAIEKEYKMKLPERSSTSVIGSKSCSSPLGASSPGTIPVPCAENAVQVESNVLDCSSTTSVLEVQKKSALSECPTEQIISSVPFNENPSVECDMDIEPIPFTPIEVACTEQSREVVNMVEASKELFDDNNDYAKQRAKLVHIRISDEQEQNTSDYITEEGTVFKPFNSSPNFEQQHGLSQLSRDYIKSKVSNMSVAVPVEDPSCQKCENLQSKQEFANRCSDSLFQTSLKEEENSRSHVATSPNLKLSTNDPLPSCTELLQDSASIKYIENANKDVPETKYLTQKSFVLSEESGCSNLTTGQDTPVLLAQSQAEHLYSPSTIEGRSHLPILPSNNKLDLLHKKEESTVASSFTSNECQQTLSSVFSGSQKHTEEDVSANMLDGFSHQRGATNLKSPPLNNLNKKSESKEEIQEASKSKLVKNTLAEEQSSSRDICISNETENRSASTRVTQNYLLDNSTHHYNLKETDESEVSYPVKNKTVEVNPVKDNEQTLSSISSKDLGSTSKVEESYNVPISSTWEKIVQNTSQAHGAGEGKFHGLLKGDEKESTSMEENSASKNAIQNSLNPPNVIYQEVSRSKEATKNITSLTQAHDSRKLSLSPKIIDSSEKNPQCMSVTSVELVKKDLPLLAEDKMEIQTNYEVLSNTKNSDSSDECKIISKPSPFNNVNDSNTKQEVGKILYDEAAQVESSSNSITSSKREVIHNIEKASSREEKSLSVLHSEKQGSSLSKTFDGSVECAQLGVQEHELPQKIFGHSVLNAETDGDIPQRDSVVSKHSKSVSVSKSSKSDCLTNSTDDKIHVTDISQDKGVKSGPVSSPNVYIQQELEPQNKEKGTLGKESSFQSLTDLKQCELTIQQQSALNYSKPEPAYIGLKESKPQEDPKVSPKPFLNETGRLSVSSVPVQFKFSKTFRTLAVSQLCSASEDSSDVESSKVNTSSSGVTRNTTASTSSVLRSSSKTLPDLPTSQQTANVIVEPSMSESLQDVSTELSQSDNQSGQLSEKDLSYPDTLQAADESQTGSSTKLTFPHISNAVSKLGVKQRQYRSRSVAQDSRTPSLDRGHASRSRSKSLSRRRRSKSSSRKKRSTSTSRKKSSHSKSVRRKHSRSRSRGRKGRSQSKSKGKKKRSTSKISGKRKRSRSKSSERIGGSKSSGKQRSSRSTSKTRKNRLQSKSPEKKGRSRSKSESKRKTHSKTASTRKRSRSKSPNWRRKSRSKSLSSRSRSRSLSVSRKHFSHSKSSLHRKRSSSRSASPRRRSRSRNKRHSFSRSPAARSPSRSRSRWHRSRSRGRWRRSRSLSASQRRSRSTSRLSSSLTTKKRKSLSPVRRRRSRSQIKQKEKSPVSKRKSSTPPPAQKKSAQTKPAGFKHSIGLKSLIQKQLSQAKSQGTTGKLSKEQIPLPNVTSRTQLSIFPTRTQASVSNLSAIGQIPIPNLAEVPLPSVSAGSQIPMPSVPPAEALSVSSLAAETQLSVPDLTTANQWHVPDMSSTTPWSVPDIAAGAQWSMADLGTGTQWPMSDLTAASHWPMHDLSVGAQWSMPDLAAGTQWAVPDVAAGAQWAMPDLAAGSQWTVPDLHAGSQWAMANLTAGAQWAVPDLAVTAQWTVPDLTAGTQIQRADLAQEAQVPGSDLAPEAQVPGSDLVTEAQVPGSDLAAEAQVPGSDMVAEAQVPPEHDLTSEERNVMPDVAAEALVPVASSTIVPDVAAGIPLPDVAVGAHMPVPDVAASIHMPDVATEAQKQMSDFVAAQAYISLIPEESVEDSHFREPILSSEHQTETDSCDAFVQESSFEPNVITSPKLKMKESSGQQVALDCFENSQSIELSEKTILVDKPDQQLNQGSKTDILNVPPVESIMESESPLSSQTCSSSDITFASRVRTDYSGHSVSVTTDPLQEHSLFDGHKSSDASLQCEPHSGSNFFVESQTSPIQTKIVEPSDDHDQPLLTVKNSMSDNNLQVEECGSSDHTLMEEPYSKSVSPKCVVSLSTSGTLLENEPLINSNTTLDINSHSISDPNEIEACVPNLSQKEDQDTSLPHPTENYTSPEHPQLVEPYASPEHPQLVEPYTSPVHPQLVEPYLSPEHPPLVELYSSPERPQLVEPYASPEFPQLVEPYSSPDRQQLSEPYTFTQQTQICQPSMSPALTENTCSPPDKPQECSISGHILTYAAVTCTQINTDLSSSDNSEATYQAVAPDVSKKQDDTPQLSKSNHASVSLQEVPCPSPLKAYSLESSLSPKETSTEEYSSTETQSVEPSIGYNLEHPASPIQLLTKQPCSPYPANQEQFSITDHKPLNFCISHEPKLDSSCVTISQQLLNEETSEDLSTKEDLQSHKDVINSEQVQVKLYSIPVQSQEDFPSSSVQCVNAADELFTECEPSSAEEPRIDDADNNISTPVLSITTINLHGGDQTCTIIPSPNRPEQETVTEHSLSEESKATSVPSNTIINLHGEDQSCTIIPLLNRREQETVAEHSLSEESKATSVPSNTIINLHGEDQSCTIIPSPNRPEQETVTEHSLSEESKATSVPSNNIINVHGEDQSCTIIPSPNRPEQETVTEHSLLEESKATSVPSNTIINLHEDQSCTIIPSPNKPEQTVTEHSLSEESKATSVPSNTIINLHGEDQSCTIIPSPNRPEQETVTEHSLSVESKATSAPSNTIINLHGGDQSCTIIASPNRPEQETVTEHSFLEHKATSVSANTIINVHDDQSCTIIPSPNKHEQETVTEHSLLEESKVTNSSGFPDNLLATQVDNLLDKPSPSSDSVMFHDFQGSGYSSLSRKISNCPNSFYPDNSSNADHSIPSEYSTQTNQGLDRSVKTDSPNITVFQSQEFDRCIENPLPTENTPFPADLPNLNQDKLRCLTSNKASDMSKCIKNTLEASAECIKTDNHFTTTPPDLLPYDSDQPTDMCSEPSSEPVPFNSQPPPELLPYDSEQPANSFLSVSDYSTEQGSSDFHAPPELLPYDSDQPILVHKQQTKPTEEKLTTYDSTTIHLETYKALDLPSVGSEENSENSASPNIHEVPDKCEPSNETVNLQLNYVKEVSSECSVIEFPSTEHVVSSETVQEHFVLSAVVFTQEKDSSSSSSTDKPLPTQQLAETEQSVIQTFLGSEIPGHPVSMSENQTEQIPLTEISEVQCASSELVNTSKTAVLPSVQDELCLETARKSSPPKSLINAESPQSQPVSRKTDSTLDLGRRHEHSRSRSIDRIKSTSKSSKNKRSRSKSETPTKKSHSKSLVRSKRSKSRSSSTESNGRSPSVVKQKESTNVHKRSSRSASVGRRKRSRSISVSPRKRSRSTSVSRKCPRRRSASQSRQRQSRSRSVTSRRRSRSSSVTRKRRSPSSSVTRKKSSSPVTRRRRSPSATRRRRSPSTSKRRRRSPSPTLRRRRSPSPSANRRRRSPSATRKRRSPSPSTSRRRRSPSNSTNRRRWSPSPSSTRRRRSPSPSTTRKRRSPTPATRRRRTPSPSASRRRRSPSSEFRRKRSPSLPVSHKRHSHSPSVPRKRPSRSPSVSRKRRSRSPSASRRRRSRSASQRKLSRSPSAPIKRSKSPSKSPTGTQSKYDRSRSLSHSEVSRKRKTRSRSSSRDKKTAEKRRKRSSSKDSSKDYHSIKQRRKSRTPPRRKKSRSPVRRTSVCKSPVRRRRSRSPVRRKSFSRSPIRRKRSRSRDKSMDSARSPKRLTDLDKAQLLEIAKANAAAMCAKAGVPLPPSLKPSMTPTAPMDDKITQRTFGGTIQELTEKCKQIAQSKEDDVIVNKPHDSDDEEEDRPFYNHPFKVSDHKPISFSLLNPTLKPAPKNQVTLTKEFPVSSGSQHRKKESDKVYGEWVPVDKATEESKDDVFTNTGPAQPVDITSAMNERAVAQTRLTGNPYDIEALYMLNRAQEQIDAWAQSTSIPGQFTGSTGAQVLSAEEISNSGPQAWLKKDQFLKAAPVTGGRGALLMRKMGWKEGEGLGRNNEGNVDPILLDFKTDRKGLVADGEKASNKLALPAMKDLSGKHPISALMELCNKKKWSPPDFELVDDTGPEHRKRFLFRVTVNGVLCQPSQPSVTKKLAKATAAAAALQALGALPKENITSTSNFCSASTSML